MLPKPFACSLGVLLAAFIGPAVSAQPANNAPAAPRAAPAQPANNAAVQEDALELARLLNPPDKIVDLVARSFDQAFDKGLAAGDERSKLEKEYPGLVAELRRATREVTLADLRADMPALHRRYARFFAAHFTPAELGELTAFYRSPTGFRIIEAKFANVDASGLIDRFAQDQDGKVTPDDITAVNKGAMSGVWKGLSADDFKALMLFGLKPVARKLKDATPRIAEIEAEITNEPDPELDAAIDDAIQKVYDRFGVDG